MPTSLDRKLRRIVYWLWPFFAFAAGIGVGVYYEYTRINAVVNASTCKAEQLTRVQSHARYLAVLNLQQVLHQFALDASRARAASGRPGDLQAARQYRKQAAQAIRVNIADLPLIRCVNGTPVPYRSGTVRPAKPSGNTKTA